MRTGPSGHKPVLLEDVLAGLITRPDGVYVDGTFGGGGHAAALLERLPEARVIALDLDPDAITRAHELCALVGPDRLVPKQANFADLEPVLRGLCLASVDGVLLDLGLSSYQLDAAERGFAIRLDGPL